MGFRQYFQKFIILTDYKDVHAALEIVYSRLIADRKQKIIYIQ
jgi:hypothetical protein